LTLDAISRGRAEVILGRGSFTESFPLFGYDLSQYEELFAEKLDLFAALIKQEPVTWHGRTRAALTTQRVFPTIESGSLKTWIGVGGSPARSNRGRAGLGPDQPRRLRPGSRSRLALLRLTRTVAQKIAATARTLGIARFDLKYSAGPLSHEKLMHSIEHYGSRVIPLVREMLA
jgi:alkanesulfonate monooxygenase SsuD/methylene tetrahydromethanopterin reductase-like flavin-dependent oxidoreductase (luciferase family)